MKAAAIVLTSLSMLFFCIYLGNRLDCPRCDHCGRVSWKCGGAFYVSLQLKLQPAHGHLPDRQFPWYPRLGCQQLGKLHSICSQRLDDHVPSCFGFPHERLLLAQHSQPGCERPLSGGPVRAQLFHGQLYAPLSDPVG